MRFSRSLASFALRSAAVRAGVRGLAEVPRRKLDREQRDHAPAAEGDVRERGEDDAEVVEAEALVAKVTAIGNGMYPVHRMAVTHHGEAAMNP